MIGFKKLAHKITNIFLALFIISAQLFAPISAIVPKAAAAGQITFGAQFENQTFPNDPNTWTNGQLDNYSEGDYVNFRYQLNATDATAQGTMLIEFDKGTCDFFTNYFDVVSSTPAIATVTAGTQTTGSQYFTQFLNVNFNTAGTTTVIFTLQLSNTAGECNGSNTGVRLGVPDDKNNTPVDENGDFDNVGAKTLPMSANSVLENPSLTISKTVESGGASPDEFYFTFSPAINGQTEVHIPEGQSSVTITEVNPDGVFTITEHGPNGYVFTGGSGTNCVDNDATIGTAGGVMTATVTAHTSAPINATCNFSNTQQKGSITIVKNTLGGDDTFNFTGNTGVTSLTTTNGTASQTVNNMVAGNYNIAETVPAGWDLTSASCSDGSPVNAIVLGAGETVTCTFTNTKRGHLIVQKTTIPAADPTSFTISTTGTGTITGGGAGSISDATDQNYEVTPGTYSVSETLPAGWSKNESACQNVVVAAGATVYCTIINTKLATLRIIKDALPNHSDNFAFVTSALPGGGSFTLDDDAGATGEDAEYSNLKTFSDLTPGVAYSVTESPLAGWQLTDLSCDTGNWNAAGSQVTVTPTAGQTVTCTYENTKLRNISGLKQIVNADGSVVAPGSGWVITLFLNGNQVGQTSTGADGSYSFTGLLPGQYTLSETLQAGFTQIFAPADVTLTYNADSTNNNFGNFQNGSVSGYKWNDMNGDGQKTDNEPKLSGWTIRLLRSDDNTENGSYAEVATTVTDVNGNYSFTNLSPLPSRFYAVCEVQQSGWIQTSPQNNACRYFEINLSGESNTDRNFGNQGRGTITVVKNVDTDGDGQINDQDVATWTWDIDGAGNFATGSGNSQSVAAGSYTVNEDQQTNYHVTASSCTGETTPQAATTSLNVTASPGENVVCTFTNTRDTGTIEVIKNINPTDDEGTFDLRINGETKKEDASHGDTTGAVQVVTGNYDVSELAGDANTSLGDYSTTLTCTKNGQAMLTNVATTDSDDFAVATGDSVVCTFTNTRYAQIIVEKQTLPDGSTQSFEFETDYDIANFPLKDGEQNNSGNLLPGTYSVGEVNIPSGWDLTSVICSDQSDPSSISLSAGETVTCVFTNTQRGSITIIKDAQPDSDQEFKFTGSLGDPDDQEGPNFTLVDDGLNDTTDRRTFDDLTTGTYTVTEPNVKGWTLESISCEGSEDNEPNVNNRNVVIDLQPGENISCTFVNTRDTADITVTKQTLPEGSEEDFTIRLRDTSEDENVVHESVLSDDESDTYTVVTGEYNLAEELLPENWDLYDAECTVNEETTFDPRNGSFEVDKDDEVECVFTNYQRAEVVVTKFNDFNRDGLKDDNEPVLPNWEFTLQAKEDCDFLSLVQIDIEFDICDFFCSIIEVDCYEYFEQQTTGENGSTTFTGVKPYVDHFLSETEQEGWEWSNTYCEYESRESYGEPVSHNNYEIYASPGEAVECFVGNYRDAYLLLEKSNNRPQPTVNGDTVTYTLTVTVPEDSNPVYGATVTDLPPEGFEFIPGSQTATKGSLTESYASPGTWTLGDLFPGEVVVLTYQTRISNSASAGTYPDIAFAEGCEVPVDGELGCSEENALFANVSAGDDTPFVGTKVTIKSPQVLAANTTVLVNTGAGEIWRNLAVGTLLMGVALATLYRREQKGGRA